jgi:hypothetical protein
MRTGILGRLFALRRRFLDRQHSGKIIALPESRILYYSIPKVACSSIMSAFVDALGIDFPADEWKPEVFQTHKWDHLFDRHAVVIESSLPPPYNRYWSFAFVRNPWDRLVSCYAEKIRPDGDPENFVNGVSRVLLPFGVFRPGMSFDDFARAVAEIPDSEAEPHFMSQHRFITRRSGALTVDFVGRFERLNEDFATIQQRISQPLALGHLLKSRRGDYKGYYYGGLRKVVAARYAEDIALFDYKFSESGP